MSVEESGEGHLPVRAHGLDAVIHLGFCFAFVLDFANSIAVCRHFTNVRKRPQSMMMMMLMFEQLILFHVSIDRVCEESFVFETFLRSD